jgi:ELWxxDGT repeat protein
MAKLQVLFEGTDSLNHQSLWLTDGTAAGTSELASAGAYSGGLFYNFSPSSPPSAAKYWLTATIQAIAVVFGSQMEHQPGSAS